MDAIDDSQRIEAAAAGAAQPMELRAAIIFMNKVQVISISTTSVQLGLYQFNKMKIS